MDFGSGLGWSVCHLTTHTCMFCALSSPSRPSRTLPIVLSSILGEMGFGCFQARAAGSFWAKWIAWVLQFLVGWSLTSHSIRKHIPHQAEYTGALPYYKYNLRVRVWNGKKNPFTQHCAMADSHFSACQQTQIQVSLSCESLLDHSSEAAVSH